MTTHVHTLFRLGLLVGVGILVGINVASAQTGPGGVGDSTSSFNQSDSLTVWLRSDKEVDDSGSGEDDVKGWGDLSGGGNDFTGTASSDGYFPHLKTGALNGHPVLRLNSNADKNEYFKHTTNQDVIDVGTDSSTIFIVSTSRKDLTSSNNPWYLYRVTGSNNFNFAYHAKDEPKMIIGKNQENLVAKLPEPITEYHLFTRARKTTDSTELSSDGKIELTDNQASDNKDGSEFHIGNDSNVSGSANTNIAEFIVFTEILNSAERWIVTNYLAERYDLVIDSSGVDYYRFGSGHPDGIAGIGKETAATGVSPGGEHTAATSSPLTIEEDTDNSNSLNDGEFVMMGHDGAAASFTTNERPNGSSNVQKTSREWRAEVTSTSQKTVDVEVDYSNLSLPSNYNDRAVYVDGDGDFTSGATRHDLDNKSGSVYEASGVPISDGDYVTVAAVKRVVNFSTMSESVQEDVNGSPDLSVQVTTNFPVESDTDISVSTDGDIDDDDPNDNPGSSDLQDNGVTNASGSNSNGDYEADGGGGNDSTTGTDCADCDNDSDGPKNGDYALQNSSVTISQGGTSATFKVNVDNDDIGIDTDGPYEQTEKFEVELGENGDSDGVREGTTDRFVGAVLDDDNPNKIAFSDPNDNDGRNKTDGNYNPTDTTEAAITLTYEVAVPSGNTGSSSPATEATYKVTGGSATADDDFKLVDGKNGTRVNATEGTVTIPDADQHGQFEVKVLEDDEYEKDETVDLELTGAQGGTIDGDDKTKITLTILSRTAEIL